MKRLFLLLLLSPAALAGGPDIEQNTTTDVVVGDSVLTGGDNTANNVASIEGSKAYGFSHSLGDVDINQCLASKQWGTILISNQKLVLNKWCVAESYDARGLYEMAARVRCDIPEIAKHFDTTKECRKANTVTVPEPPPPPPAASHDEDEEDAHDALLARLEAIESARDNEAQRARSAAREAQKAAQETRQAEIDRKEYAQQLIEELKEWE